MFNDIDPNWPSEVIARLHHINDNESEIAKRSAEIDKKIPKSNREAMFAQAGHASTSTKRLFWLRREADMVSAAAASVSACKKGCSSCCNIGVMLLESEARCIGREIGRKPAQPPVGKFLATGLDQDMQAAEQLVKDLASEFTGTPCPFLGANSQCDIYSHRPLACRLQINMDVDDLLCRLIPGGAVPVPYLNVFDSKMACILAFGQNNRMADIRYFFPTSSGVGL